MGVLRCSTATSPARDAAQVRARQLWGNIVYTQDSDLVAVLMHNGFYNHSLQQPPASMAEVPSLPGPFAQRVTSCAGFLDDMEHLMFCCFPLKPGPLVSGSCAYGV